MREEARVWVFHPPLFAIHPALTLLGANVSILSLKDAALPLVVLVVASLAMWGFLAWLFRDPVRSASAVSFVFLSLFSFKGIAILGGKVGLPSASAVLVWGWALATLAIAALLLKQHPTNGAIAKLANFIGVVIVAFAVGIIVVENVAVSKELKVAVSANPSSPQSNRSERLPDVYYVVLDGYGRTDTFERLYGFSDQEFIDALRERGFYVAEDARSNYAQTELSMASSLNLSFVQDLVRKKDSPPRVRSNLDALIDRSEVSRRFRELGYKFFAVTTGFPALLIRSADVRFHRSDGTAIFLSSLFSRTPFGVPSGLRASQYENRRLALEGGFDVMKGLAPQGQAPKFVLVHILSPHPPFVFGPNGEKRTPIGRFGLFDGSHFNDEIGTDADYLVGYRDQAQFVAKRMLETIDALIELGNDPVILIHGDHGPKMKVDQNLADRTDHDELFSILLAFRAPRVMQVKLYPEITPVNAFRIYFSHQHDADLPPLPDRSFYSPWEAPLEFVEVTDRLARRSESAGRATATSSETSP